MDNPRYGQKALLSKADYDFVKQAIADFLKAADKAARNDGSPDA